MRLSLEQLKAMSDEQLYRLWFSGKFPFDGALGCKSCLTQHVSSPCHLHPEMTAAATGAWKRMPHQTEMHSVIEELYALRLFYDHLYPQPEPTIAESQARITRALQRLTVLATSNGQSHEEKQLEQMRITQYEER